MNPDPRPVLLVGESNPYDVDPIFALYDEPMEASGYRLRKILGVTSETYRGRGIERVNLARGSYTLRKARARAIEIAIRARDYRLVVLLGAKVRDAFGLDCEFFEGRGLSGARFLCLPHPSGRCLIWNQDGQIERARALLRARTDLPIGEET